MSKDSTFATLTVKISKADMSQYTDGVYSDMANPAFNGINLHNADQSAHNLTTRFGGVETELGLIWAELDTKVDDVDISNKANRTGDTFTGAAVFDNVTPAAIVLNNSTTITRSITSTTNGTNRWEIQVANSDGEIGSNNGSNFAIGRYSDTGSFLGTPFKIDRRTGIVYIDNLQVGSSNIGGNTGYIPTRIQTVVTTGAIDDGEIENAYAALSPSYQLLRIATNVPARVRLYASTDARTVDADRPSNTNPSGDHEVMLDFTTDSNDLDWALSPLVDGYVAAGSDAPIAITNLSGSTQPVEVILTWIKRESAEGGGGGGLDQPTADTLYIQRAMVEGKGDLLIGSGDNIPAVLPVGSDGQVLVADSGSPSGLAWAPAPSGGAPSPTRTTAQVTTALLPANTDQTGTVALGKAYRLYRIQTDVPARIRLYTTTAKRDAAAERGRSIGVRPDNTIDHGLLFEYITGVGLLAADLAPMVDGFDGKATPDGAIPYTIANLDSQSRQVTVTFTYKAEEL